MSAYTKNTWIILSASIILLLVYTVILGSYIPNKHGQLGGDYSFYLPALLDGYFWYHTNGLWEIPWFTPSFCGGSLNSININNGYYTVPQFLAFLVDPLSAVRLTFIVFAGLGFYGFYLLLRRCFLTGPYVALLGSGLFLFNGFYAHRMLAGHLFVHGFMLVPFITFILLRPLPKDIGAFRAQLVFDMIIGGFVYAYMTASGFSSFMIPCGVSIVITGLIHGLLYGKASQFWLRWIGAALAGILFSASKLTAVFFVMRTFSRSAYKLPGAEYISTAAWLLFKSLFISPAFDSDRMNMLTNVQWTIERHEWEYSVTIVPLVILILCGGLLLRQMLLKNVVVKPTGRQYFQIAVIGVLLLLPIALNTYAPAWNAFLKQLPLIKSASSLIRWFVIYIPIVILVAALMLEKIDISSKYQPGIVVIGLAAMAAFNVLANRDVYLERNYDPAEIVESYRAVKAGAWTPQIKSIGVYVDAKGQVKMLIKKNNLLIYGASQLYCYEPMFGYRLEDFPIKRLHPGPVLEAQEGVLNMKNPACYVWPQANQCLPGDHFTVAQKKEAEAFVNYRPFAFQIPAVQKTANWINNAALVAAVLFLLFYAAKKLSRRPDISS